MRYLDPARIKLEVERDPIGAELNNLIQNPSGDLGGFGWITPSTGSVMAGDPYAYAPGSVLTYSGVAGHSEFYTESIPVTAGQYIAASFTVMGQSGSLYYTYVIDWLDSTGTYTGQTTATVTTGTGAKSIGAVVIPSGTVSARLHFTIYQSTLQADPTGAHAISLRNVTMATAATGAALGSTFRYNLLGQAGAALWPANTSADATLTGISPSSAWSGGALTYITGSTGVSGSPAHYNKTGTGNVTITSTIAVPVTSGTYTGSMYVRAELIGESAQVFIEWHNAAGAVLSTSTGTTVSTVTGSWARPTVTAIAPTGATSVRLGVIIGTTNIGSGYINAAMIEQAGSVGNFTEVSESTGGTLPSLPPAYYVDILGESASITVNRKELDLGTLSAQVISTALDPAMTTILRPGRRVRLSINTDATYGSGAYGSGAYGYPDPVWEEVFVGRTAKAAVEYALLDPDTTRRAIITLTAVDGLAQLTQQARPNGVYLMSGLRAVLEGCGVPWNVNGNKSGITSATYVATNDNASAVDQIAITRDSRSGYAWLDRHGVLQAWDANAINTTVAATLTETDYADTIGIDFSTDRAINIVDIDALAVGPDGKTVTTSYGPYRDEASIRTWGALSKKFTVQGLNASAIATLAAGILAANKTPERRINFVDLEVTNTTTSRAIYDLYDLITVTNTRAGLSDNQRIVALSHTINATPYGAEWITRLEFAGDSTVAPPQLVPAPPTGSPTVTSKIGTAVLTTGSGGIVTIPFGVTFPSPPIVVVAPGDDAGGLAYCAPTTGATTTGQQVVCFGTSGAVLASGATIRLNYYASI